MPRPRKSADVPVNNVLDMRKQGLENNQIARNLQSTFQPEQISDAMNQADIKSAMGENDIPPGLRDAPSPTSSGDVDSEMPTFNPSPNETPAMPETQMAAQPMTFQSSGPQGFAPPPGDRANYNIIEEIAESIVQEKWDKLISGVGDIKLWKEKVESDITGIKQEILRTQHRLENVQKAVLGKVSAYSESMEGISSDIKALEKVFEKIVNPLTKNIKDLDRITKKLKKK